MNERITISRFDQVKLLSTKNIKYLSAPPGTQLSPHGIWSVAAAIGDELLLVKNNVVVKVPTSDVLRIASYEISHLLNRLGRLSRGEETRNKSGNEENKS